MESKSKVFQSYLLRWTVFDRYVFGSPVISNLRKYVDVQGIMTWTKNVGSKPSFKKRQTHPKPGSHEKQTDGKLELVGGFTPTHSKNMLVKLDHLGLKIQNNWNHHAEHHPYHPSWLLRKRDTPHTREKLWHLRIMGRTKKTTSIRFYKCASFFRVTFLVVLSDLFRG